MTKNLCHPMEIAPGWKQGIGGVPGISRHRLDSSHAEGWWCSLHSGILGTGQASASL